MNAASVNAWRTRGDYMADPGEPQAEDLATVAYTGAIVSAAAASASYTSDKLAGLHGRRPVNDTIDQALTELRPSPEASTSPPANHSHQTPATTRCPAGEPALRPPCQAPHRTGKPTGQRL